MTTPLDQHKDNRRGKVRFARLFSNIVSPPVIFAIVGLLLSLQAAPLPEAILWAAIYGFMVSLLPILFVLWLLKTGRIAELHMSNTSERHLPYLIAIMSSAVLYGILWLFNGPEMLRCLAVFNMITLGALGIINTFWLISFHAAAIGSTWYLISLVYGWQAGLIVAIFVLLVVFVRLYLKRHTPAQIVAGLALGLSSVWLLTQFGCFV